MLRNYGRIEVQGMSVASYRTFRKIMNAAFARVSTNTAFFFGQQIFVMIQPDFCRILQPPIFRAYTRPTCLDKLSQIIYSFQLEFLKYPSRKKPHGGRSVSDVITYEFLLSVCDLTNFRKLIFFFRNYSWKVKSRNFSTVVL